MFELLDRFYEFSKRHVYLYPIFVFIKLVLYLIPLFGQEGLCGGLRWLGIRLKFAYRNRRILGSPTLLDQPIEAYVSRHGFTLSRFVQYAIYDEIFLERVYEFSSLRRRLSALPGGLVIDFGVHHGLFINFVQTMNPQFTVFGAELSPRNHDIARGRFAGTDKVTLSNVGIGGAARNVSIQLTTFSACQSIYTTEGEERADVRIITPVEFLALHQLTGKKITLLKMDIEGAEKEVFENFDSFREVLKLTSFFIIEIHATADVPLITSRMESVGFERREKRGINYLFANTAGQ